LREPNDDILSGVAGANQWQIKSISLGIKYFVRSTGVDPVNILLAAFCHQRKGGLLLFIPIPSNIRVGKMEVANWFDLYNVNQFT
jgi:hypothetical protein